MSTNERISPIGLQYSGNLRPVSRSTKATAADTIFVHVFNNEKHKVSQSATDIFITSFHLGNSSVNSSASLQPIACSPGTSVGVRQLRSLSTMYFNDARPCNVRTANKTKSRLILKRSPDATRAL